MDATDLGDMQTSMLKLETEISQLANRQYRTRQVEIETLLAFCMQLRAFSARLFDLQTRLMTRQGNFCMCDENTDNSSEPECQP